MKEHIYGLIIIAFIIGGFALLLANSIGIDDIDAYEQCIKEHYGMTPTEVYQKTGKKPVCNQ